MKRTLKSATEIEDEVAEIFKKYKDENILASKLLEYINNITGKELTDRTNILISILSGILHSDFDKIKLIFCNKDLAIALYPVVELFFKFRNSSPCLSSHSLGEPMNKFSEEMIVVCDEFRKYLKPQTPSNVVKRNVLKKEITYKKFHNFLKTNKDVEKLLDSFLFQAKQKMIIKLILDDIIPLHSILLYFDSELNVKQNTEMFYKLFGKKVPRLKIQSVILDNIKRIKEGKYSVLGEYVYDERSLERVKSKMYPLNR